jgi:hypothetical protein
MPMVISFEAIAIWVCLGFFVGLGWFVASWLVSRVVK